MAGASSTQQAKKLHIAFFPYLAFGHMLPYLKLAKLISQKGHIVTFISTPLNISRLPSSPPSSNFTFLSLPLPHIQNLPPNAESTMDLPDHKVPLLEEAFDLLQQPVADFLKSSKPDWILYDYAAYWLPDVARDFGVPSAFFSAFPASTLSMTRPTSPQYIHVEEYRTKPQDFTVPPKWVPFPSNVAFRYFEIAKIFRSGALRKSRVSFEDRMVEALRAGDAVAVRSSYEFQLEWLELLKKLHGKPVVPVGLLPSPTAVDITAEEDERWQSVKSWLDEKEKGSVVYVAFGSEAKPNQCEITELALGLEQSKLPFFWVLRTPHGNSEDAAIELPEGFEERTRGRGVVWTSWAPQLKVLGHDSVGGFLNQAGWSSIVEGIQKEKPLVLLTFWSDQGLNARVLEDKKMGYVIPRDEGDGSFSRETVAKSLRLVMVDEEGKVYRDKAKEMSKLFGDMDIQSKYIDELLHFLRSHGHEGASVCDSGQI